MAGPATSLNTETPMYTSDIKDQLDLIEAESKPLKITLGVEIECILGQCKYPDCGLGNGTISGSNLGAQMVTDVLSQPIPAKCATCGVMHSMKLRILPYMSPFSDYSTWSVVTDSSLRVGEDEKSALGDALEYFDFYPVEIRSRVLRADKNLPTARSTPDPTHTHSVSYDEEVSATLDHLKAAFNTHNNPLSQITQTFRLFTNHTTGVHVHVGNKRKGFPLQTAKNIMSTYVACERQIDRMQAAHRIGGSSAVFASQDDRYIFAEESCFKISTSYNVPMSSLHACNVHSIRQEARTGSIHHSADKYPRTGLNDPTIAIAGQEHSIAAHLALVQRASSVADLEAIIDGWGHKCTVNLENLFDFAPNGLPPNRQKMTVEFRQHGSTLDSGKVIVFMDFVASLVRHAHDTPDGQYAEFCNTVTQSPRTGTVDIITAIGCSEKTLQQYSRRLSGDNAGFDNDLFTEEMKAINSFGQNDSFRTLMMTCLNRDLADYSIIKINDKILKKLLRGGYGQFSDAFLEQIPELNGQRPIIKERLRVGWTNPACQSPTSYSDAASSPRQQRDSPISDSSADMVGYAVNENEIAFTMQPASGHDSRRPPSASRQGRAPRSDSLASSESPISDSCAEMVGHATNENGIAFTIQRKPVPDARPPPYNSGERPGLLESIAGDDDDLVLSNLPSARPVVQEWSPLDDDNANGPQIHPDRLALINEAAGCCTPYEGA